MEITSYPKSELALMYFPKSDPHVALNHLNSWIKGCPELAEKMAGCHQSRFAKFYSPQAVRLIVEYLGEP
jgi:hypothetical protein